MSLGSAGECYRTKSHSECPWAAQGNVIGQKAVVNVPGQRRANITLCPAISLQGVVHHHATLGPYNTTHIIRFLDALHNTVVQDGPEQPRFVVIWDNVSFHRAALVRDWFTNHWFTNHNNFTVVYLPPYSPSQSD